jgi:hypothetical protein
MKKRVVMMVATLVGLAQLELARAENLGSKLADMVASSTRPADGTSGEPIAAPAPADEAERQVLDAEARDGANRELQNARDEQK